MAIYAIPSVGLVREHPGLGQWEGSGLRVEVPRAWLQGSEGQGEGRPWGRVLPFHLILLFSAGPPPHTVQGLGPWCLCTGASSSSRALICRGLERGLVGDV